MPQNFSVADEFDIIFTGTNDDQEDCILAIELIQDIKPDEGKELSDVSPWNAVVRLEMDVNVSCVMYFSFLHLFMCNKVTAFQRILLV